MAMVYVGQHEIVFTEELAVEVHIRRPGDPEALLVFQAEPVLHPGDSVTWKYPDDGLKIVMD